MVCAFAALSVRGWGGYLCIAMFPPSAASGGRRPLRPQGAASAGSASRAELVGGENWCGRHALSPFLMLISLNFRLTIYALKV